MDIATTLTELGLSDKEAKLYLALLEHGDMTGYELAGFMGLKPTATYYTLDELRKKGLVNKIPYTSKQVFSARDPRDVVSQMHEKVKKVESALPKLLSLANVSTRANVHFFEGLTGCEQAFDMMTTHAKNKKMIGFYMYKDMLSEDQMKIDAAYKNKLLNIGCTIRGLSPEAERLKKHVDTYSRNDNISLKYLSRELYSPETSIETVGPATMIASYDLGQHLVIENHELARSMRQIFELLWNSADFIGSDQYPGVKK